MRLVTHFLAPVLLGAAISPSGLAQPAGWTALDGPHAAGLHTAAIASDGTLIAGTQVDVLRNAGAGWAEVAGAVNGSIHDVAAAPGGRVWAGTSGALRSDDGGQSWQWFSIRTAPHSGTHPSVLHVAQSPTGMTFAGGFRSPDAGASWPQMSIYAQATAFVGPTVYAGTFSGIHRSSDGGASWTPSGLEGFPVPHMAASGTRLVAAGGIGLLVSNDGQNWVKACALPGVNGLAVDGAGAVWAAAADGLHRSPEGQSWPCAPQAFIGRRVDDVAAAGNKVLALVEGNPHVSVDGGVTWTQVQEGLGFPFATTAVAAAGVLAVAANGAGPFRSTDAGVTWAPWRDGLGNEFMSRMVVDQGAGLAFAQSHVTLHRASLDGGIWSSIPLPEGIQPRGLASDGATLFAVADGVGLEHLLFRSTDAGATWDLVQTESDALGSLLAAGGGVAVASAVGFSLPPRLLVSVDGGGTWASRPHPTAPTFGAAPAIFVDDAGQIYVEDGNRLLRSSDLAESWTTLGGAGPDNNRITALNSTAGALCLGTISGVWCSTDDGASFTAAGAGLPGGGTAGIAALARDGARYFALTDSDGVFTSDAVVAGGPPADGGTPLALAVAPNPTGARAELTLSLRGADDVRIVVFDALGREVEMVHEGALPAGEHVFPVRAGRYAPGLYVIQAYVGASRLSSRMVVR